MGSGSGGEKEMCTLETRGRVHIITFTGDGEHRLNPDFLASFRRAIAQARAAGAAALVTAAEGRFFCNGFDLNYLRSVVPAGDRHLSSDHLRAAVADLLLLPCPTFAAITGHVAAGGVGLALAHDHLVMRADRGFIYMSEVDIGMTLPGYFAAILRAKIGDAALRRDLLLGGRRTTASEAARMGLIDRAVAGAPREVVEATVTMAEGMVAKGWNGQVIAAGRKALMPELWKAVSDGEKDDRARGSTSAKL